MMHIQIDQMTFRGSGVEILDQLRGMQFDPFEFPDNETYLWQLQTNFIRMTGQNCLLPKGDLAIQATAMLHHLASIGALRFLEEDAHV